MILGIVQLPTRNGGGEARSQEDTFFGSGEDREKEATSRNSKGKTDNGHGNIAWPGNQGRMGKS